MGKQDTIDERLNKNDKDHNAIMEKFDAFKDDINEKFRLLSIEIAKMPEKILEKADDRYASKTVEKALYGAIGATCVALIMWVIDILKS